MRGRRFDPGQEHMNILFPSRHLKNHYSLDDSVRFGNLIFIKIIKLLK